MRYFFIRRNIIIGLVFCLTLVSFFLVYTYDGINTRFILLALIFLLLLAVLSWQIMGYKHKESNSVSQVNYLADLVTQTSDAIISTDKDFRVKTWNKGAEKMYGYSEEDTRGLLLDILKSRLSAEDRRIKMEDLHKHSFHQNEFEYSHKNGKTITVLGSFTALRNKKDEISGYVAVHRDITERKHLEEQLKELTDNERKKAEQTLLASEETTRLIMNSSLDAIICMDIAGMITVWTPQAEKLFGWKKEQVIGKTLASTIIPPQYRERHKKGLENYLLSGTGPVINRLFEITALDHTGREFPIEMSIIPVKQGSTEFFCGFLRDITKRKKAQLHVEKEKLLSDSIINSLPGVFYLFDKNGKYIRWNKYKEMITGYSGDEISRMHPVDFFEGDEKELIRDRIAEAFKRGETAVEAHFVSKTGVRTPFYFTGVTVEYEGMPCLLGMGINITERKKSEQELEKSYKAIRQLTNHLQTVREEERTNIAREIHDELGQQLTVLKMDVSWLNKKIAVDDDTVKQKLNNLSEMLDGTVKSVRRISSQLRPSLLDDLGLIAAMEWHLKEFEQHSGIRTEFSEFGNTLILPDIIKTGLFRIFQESLTNVARHSDAKKVRVCLQQNRGNIILSIEDNGKGFDKQKTINKKTLGILGMEERTTMMGGSYNIKSDPGKGTTVVVSIPGQME